MYKKIVHDLQQLKNPTKAKILQGFFKTGIGEYGEGDIFWGIVMPLQRRVVKKYFKETSLTDIQKLLNSKIHEQRMVGVLMLVEKYKSYTCHPRQPCRLGRQSGDPVKLLDPSFHEDNTKKDDDKKQIFNFYLKNTKNINNWDLVDLSAPNIVGQYLLSVNHDKHTSRLVETHGNASLGKLIQSKNLWERRIAVLATFAFIRDNKFSDSLKIAEILLTDKHDLIHKAVGWMLREIGKRDLKTLENFLNNYYKIMPRTMLRYAIEKLTEKKRKFYLHK